MALAVHWILAFLALGAVCAQPAGNDCLDCRGLSAESQIRRCVTLAVASSLNLQDLPNSHGETVKRLMQSSCDYVRSDNSDPDPCSMVPGMIVCVDQGSGRYIHGIYISKFRLGGRLPPQLSFATNLQDLHIDGGKIEGTLPREWSSLTNLRSLVLRGNELSGKLPKEWTEMRKLESLDVSDNKLSGGIPDEWANLDLRSVKLSDNPKMRSSKCPYWYNLTTLNLGDSHLACNSGSRKKYCLDNKKRLEQEGRKVVLRDFRGDMCSNEQRDVRLGLAWGVFGFIAICICLDTFVRLCLIHYHSRRQSKGLMASQNVDQVIKAHSMTVTVGAVSQSGLASCVRGCWNNTMVKGLWKYKDAIVAGWDVVSDVLLAIQVYPNWPFYLIVLTMFLPDIITCTCILLNLTRTHMPAMRALAVALGLPFLAPTLPLMLLLAVLQHQFFCLRRIPHVFHHVSPIRVVELLHWMIGFIEAPALAVLTSCIYYIGNKPEIGWFIDWRIFVLSLASAFLDMVMHLWRLRNLFLTSATSTHTISSMLRSMFTDLHLPLIEGNECTEGHITLDRDSMMGSAGRRTQPGSPRGVGGETEGSNVTAVQQVANALTQVAVTAANAV